jgi:hypothetical protein
METYETAAAYGNVGLALAVLGIGVGLVGLWLWCWRRHKRETAMYDVETKSKLQALLRESISSAASEVLGQMFVHGPTWDGNVVSKSGRDELVRAGLAFRIHGFASLTAAGLDLAISWPQTDRNGRWYCKQHDVPWPREGRGGGLHPRHGLFIIQVGDGGGGDGSL